MELKIGDVCRVRCTAIGRYIGGGKALFVASMNNDLCVDDVKTPIDSKNEHDLPLPSDKDVARYASGNKCDKCGQKL